MAGDETTGGSGHPFHPFEVNAPHLAYAFLGGFVVLFSLCSLFIKERLYIGEAVVSTVVGIVLGPYALNLFSPGSWGGHNHNSEVTDEITLEVTRVVIAVGVFAIGVELPKKYVKHHWKSLAFLVGPVMAWGWLVTALFMWALIPHLEFLTCLAIAACVTPTDPILAQAVVGGRFATKHVPAHIRHLLSAESGCNDGAAFPFLFLALYLILETDDGYAVGEWFYITWPGESIRINRDDDGEIADDGITDRGDPMVISTEKDLTRSPSNSLGSGSGTVTGLSGEQQDTPFQTGGGERADVEALENGTYTPDVANRHERPGEEGQVAQEDIEELYEAGRTTPILAEYREGHHLVRERKKDDTESVEVQVIQNYFDKDKPTKATSFRHPRPLKHYEVDILHDKLQHSPDYAADHVREGGRDRVDRLGLGMMGVEETRDEAREENEREMDNETRERVLEGGESEHAVRREQSRRSDQYSGDMGSPQSGDRMPTALSRSDSTSTGCPADREDEGIPHDTYGHPLHSTNTRGTQNANEEYELGRVSSRVSAVFGGGRKKGRQLSITKRFLGGLGKKPDSEDHVRPRDIEEGRTAVDTDNGNLTPSDSVGKPILSPATTIQRSGSPPRNLSLRFAPDTAQSSETAPGPSSYKRPAPNPSLSMYRSSTLQPGSQSQAEETPKGNQYYKRGHNNPSLAMFRAKTVNDTDSLNEGEERQGVSFRLPNKKAAGAK
ncbi:hypothetical protein QFC19_000019 [Naganishia cerealis]|uniref:Uncharacterized protein n=1 Tax=Naganishia cerealis TaxID=610337 RepID=A0ACC2WQZ6_9TREE|nr:hypothetical protein QFC19_000019 [Naganishia cerealis]